MTKNQTTQAAKFTKGPWQIMYSTDENGKCALAVWPHGTKDGDMGSPICKISPQESENDQDRANAKLIASAPALYEALKELIENIGEAVEWKVAYEITKSDNHLIQAGLSPILKARAEKWKRVLAALNLSNQ